MLTTNDLSGKTKCIQLSLLSLISLFSEKSLLMWRPQLHRRKPTAARRENSGAGRTHQMGTWMPLETQPMGREPLVSLCPGQGPLLHQSYGPGGRQSSHPACRWQGHGRRDTDGWKQQCHGMGLHDSSPSSLPTMAVLVLPSGECWGVSYTQQCQQKLCCCSTSSALMMWTGTARLFGIGPRDFQCFPFLSTRVEGTDWPGKAASLDLRVYISCSVRRLVNIKLLTPLKGVVFTLSLVWDAVSLYQLFLYSPLTEASCSKHCFLKVQDSQYVFFAIFFPYDCVLNVEYGLMAKRLSHLSKMWM